MALRPKPIYKQNEQIQSTQRYLKNPTDNVINSVAGIKKKLIQKITFTEHHPRLVKIWKQNFRIV